MKSLKSFLLLCVCAAFFSCTRKNQPEAAFSVTASTFPCYDAARAVLGSAAADGTVGLKLLVKPGTEVHSFDPSPADIIAVQKSSLFIYAGGESDEWVEKVLESGGSESPAKKLRLMEFVETADEVSFGEEDAEDEEEHSHGKEAHSADESLSAESAENPHEQDEHIWTSPANELKIIDAVYEALCETARNAGKPELCAAFEMNANKYKEEISSVAEKTAAVIAAAQEQYIVMADRFPFLYFANYYGLSFDAAFSGCSTAVEASTATISRLIDTVKAKNLPAVFYIELGNHKIADSIAEACNVSAIELQSCQNVSKKDFDAGETWVSLMERNAAALKKGLR